MWRDFGTRLTFYFLFEKKKKYIDKLVITEFEIKEEDKFIIIASDGIWEFLSSIAVKKKI
jgi:serine/threonine protein phosphatase PrpC